MLELVWNLSRMVIGPEFTLTSASCEILYLVKIESLGALKYKGPRNKTRGHTVRYIEDGLCMLQKKVQ